MVNDGLRWVMQKHLNCGFCGKSLSGKRVGAVYCSRVCKDRCGRLRVREELARLRAVERGDTVAGGGDFC